MSMKIAICWAICLIVQFQKISIPLTGEIFLMTATPSGFSKIGLQNRFPLPSGNSILPHTPRKYYHSWGKSIKSKLYLAQNTKFWSLPFSKNLVDTVTNIIITRRYIAYLKDAYCRFNDTKIVDLIQSILLHNFDNLTAVTKKFISKTIEREMLKKKHFTSFQK